MTLELAALWLMRVAGASQLALCAGSLAIPAVMRWEEKLASLPVLERQMFWNYSHYIWGTNLAFGLVSALGAPWLLDGSPLAACVCGFCCVYWLGRVLVQWLVFDLSEVPQGGFHTVARWLLELLFVALTAVYGLGLALNLDWV